MSKHCDTCTCKAIRKKPMHRKHVFKKEPSYISVENGKRYGVYLCLKTITGEQRCWATKQEELGTPELTPALAIVTDSQKITRSW